MYQGRTERSEETGVLSEKSQRMRQVKKAVSWTHPAESQMPVWRVRPVFKTPWMLMRAPDKRAIRKPNIAGSPFLGK